MKNENIFAKPGALIFFSLCAEVLALVIVYLLFIDEFLHSFLFFFLYLTLFILSITVSSSFNSGKKELFKASTVSLFTICFVFHAMGFVDMLSLNYYYFFSGNYIITCIGLIAILLFLLFAFTFIKHFYINSSNESKTKDVLLNKTILIIVGLLSLVQAGLIVYNDTTTGRMLELYLALSYIMFFFISLILICVETLINGFRLARERGELKSYATKLVGKEAANVATGKKVKKRKSTRK